VRGFSLVELMVATAISAIVVATMLSAFIFFAKTSLKMSNYYDMSQASRTFLFYFSRDIREAEAIEWKSNTEFALTSKGSKTNYAYDSLMDTVSRQVAGEAPLNVASELEDLEFRAFSISGDSLRLNGDLQTASQETKAVQVLGGFRRITSTTVETTTPLISARYMLRNKVVKAP